jgi:hypothetical protein
MAGFGEAAGYGGFFLFEDAMRPSQADAISILAALAIA